MSSVLSKLHTAAWFAARPSFWMHMAELARRAVTGSADAPQDKVDATRWAEARAVDTRSALEKVGLDVSKGIPAIAPDVLAEAERRAAASPIAMGGPGDLRLLYAAARLNGASRIVETGVAYGWSSLVLLQAIADRPRARLVSVDMPYPKLNNEAVVGIVVPDRLRQQWTLVRKPDRNGLREAIAKLGGTIDLCHYDSDKSRPGRVFGYALMWEALAPGGLFISDDIQDNLAFADFVAQKGQPWAVTFADNRHVGLMRKNG